MENNFYARVMIKKLKENNMTEKIWTKKIHSLLALNTSTFHLFSLPVIFMTSGEVRNLMSHRTQNGGV